MTLKFLALTALLILLSTPAHPAWTVLGSRWRPDGDPFGKTQPWDGTVWSEGWALPEQFWPDNFHPAGTIHVVLRNTGSRSASLHLTQMNGRPIAEIATTPAKTGAIVWHRLDAPQLRTAPDPTAAPGDPRWQQVPLQVPAGQWAECVIRLRASLQTPATLTFGSEDGQDLQVEVPARPLPLRIESVSFSPDISRVYLYLRDMRGREPVRPSILLDAIPYGKTSFTPGSPGSGLLLVEAVLPSPWEYGTHHLVEVALPDGTKLAQPVRASDGYFTIGLYGTIDENRVRAAKQHGINTYFTGGVSQVPIDAGLNIVPMAERGNLPARTTGQAGVLFYQNHDEPDAHDWHRGEDLPPLDRLGVLGQTEVLPRQRYQRAVDPLVPNLLLVNNTYKPLNWYMYGQISDIYCTDPYVPLNGRQMDYVWRALEVARDASAPRPLVSVLWACGLSAPSKKFGNRPPTAEEGRISVLYALGSGVKGISYFIDMTAETGEGQFTGLSDIPDLWEEVGRTNRDVSALAPYLAIGCPMSRPEVAGPAWARALLCGPDRILVFTVNERHHIGFETRSEYAWHFKAEDVSARLKLPPSFSKIKVEELVDGNFASFAGAVREGQDLKMNIGEIDTGRVFLITRQAQ